MKSKINSILNLLSFSVYDQNFFSGYGLLPKAKDSVCHFKLKELEDFKFSIWLNEDDSFSIFGDHQVLLDKLKPNSCYISSTSIESFSEEIHSILNKEEKHFSYLQEIEEEKLFLKNKNDHLSLYESTFNDFKNSSNHNLVLNRFDQGLFITSYQFSLLQNISIEEEIELYKSLSILKDSVFSLTSFENLYEVDFFIMFNHLNHILLYSETEYKFRFKKDFETFIYSLRKDII